MAAYGPDKLDDPVKAEPVIIRLIQLDPGEPANYFQLAKLYEDAGEYEAAEKVYLAAKDAKPTDPNVYMQLAGYYNRQGKFDKTIEAFEQRAQTGAEQPGGLLHDRHPVLGSGLPRRGREGSGQEDLRREGHQGDRPRDPDQARLRRSARLQGPPAPAARRNLETNPGQAAGAHQAGRLASRQGRGNPQAKATGVGD